MLSREAANTNSVINLWIDLTGVRTHDIPNSRRALNHYTSDRCILHLFFYKYALLSQLQCRRIFKEDNNSFKKCPQSNCCLIFESSYYNNPTLRKFHGTLHHDWFRLNIFLHWHRDISSTHVFGDRCYSKYPWKAYLTNAHMKQNSWSVSPFTDDTPQNSLFWSCKEAKEQ